MNSNSEVPKFVEAFGPILQALVNVGGAGHKNAVIQEVAYLVPSTFDDIAKTERVNSEAFRTHIYKARTYLSSAGYVEYKQGGIWSITDAGRAHAEMTNEEAVVLFMNTTPAQETQEE